MALGNRRHRCQLVSRRPEQREGGDGRRGEGKGREGSEEEGRRKDGENRRNRRDGRRDDQPTRQDWNILGAHAKQVLSSHALNCPPDTGKSSNFLTRDTYISCAVKTGRPDFEPHTHTYTAKTNSLTSGKSPDFLDPGCSVLWIPDV